VSQLVDRIKNHQVWKQLQALGPAIDSAVTRDGVDATQVDGLERLRAVLAFVGKRLAAADPATTQPSPLDSISAALQAAINEVQAFVANGSPGHIDNANAQGDTALTNLAQVNVPTTPKELAGVKDAASDYRSTLEAHLRKANETIVGFGRDADGLKARLAELTNEISTERQKLSQLTTEFQAQFSTAQEARSRDYTDAQGARQEKFGVLMADFTERLTTQNADFSQKKELAFKQYEEDVKLLKKNYADSAQAMLDQIDAHRKDVEKLVGVIGNLGVTSGYQKTANYARRAAWFWQAVTVVALGGVIIVAYSAFIPLVQGTFTWESFAGRVFVSLTVGVLAAYARSQADKHLEMEHRNRKLALELEAIGPYLATPTSRPAGQVST